MSRDCTEEEICRIHAEDISQVYSLRIEIAIRYKALHIVTENILQQ